MSFETHKFHFIPKDKEVEHTFEKLINYPVVRVKPTLAQNISRHKKIRYLSSCDNIWIRKGLIGISPKVKIKRNGKGFDFFFP